MKRTIRQKLTAFLTGAAMFFSSIVLPAGIQPKAEQSEDVYEISIVSTNDIHARAAASESGFGFEKIKTIADAARKSSDLTLLLDAGDFYHGQAFATLTNGESIAKLAAAAGYDAVCVGNHDWSYGQEQLRSLAQLSAEGNSSGNFALLGGNVKQSSGGVFFDQEYFVKELPIQQKDTVKVGVFGLIDPRLYSKTAPSNVSGLVFEDMTAYARQAAAELTAQGCDIVIGMAHCIDPAALAASVSGVDLWIAGHEHISLQEQVSDQAGEQVYVLEAGYYGSEVDVTQLSFSYEAGASGEYEVSDLTVTPDTYKEEDIEQTASDETIAALYQSLSDAQAPILQEKIGETPVKLEASWEGLRIGETTMGRLVNNAYLKETGADIAMENAGGIRTGRDIEAGTLIKKDAVDTFPYGNYLVTKRITGAQLKELLEISIDIGIKNQAANDAGNYDGWPENSGSYMQVGGVQVRYDVKKERGSRIWSLKVGNKPVDDTAYYTAAVNNYMAGSGDYPMLAEAEIINEYSACDEIFIKYIQQAEPEALKEALQAACMIQEADSSQAGADKPKAAAVKKLTAKKRGFQVKWTKCPSVTGYQIRYSTDKMFQGKSTQTIKIAKQNVTKKTVKGLEPKQVYYIKIRTYKNESGNISTSAWSEVKKIKTLK